MIKLYMTCYGHSETIYSQSYDELFNELWTRHHINIDEYNNTILKKFGLTDNDLWDDPFTYDDKKFEQLESEYFKSNEDYKNIILQLLIGCEYFELEDGIQC